MNIMRKWWGAGGQDGGLEGRAGSISSGSFNGSATSTSKMSQEQQQHLALGLMHLKKLFSELLYPVHPLSEDEREDKLYNMLPLFCKVFGACPSTDLQEKFADVLLFTQHVSKLMVTEIRRRASNQSTAAASCAIARFLEVDGGGGEDSAEGGPSSGGWLLLNALNLLADGPPEIIEVMTSSSLPSTLVKCLYLFFDLPDPESSDAEGSTNPGCGGPEHPPHTIPLNKWASVDTPSSEQELQIGSNSGTVLNQQIDLSSKQSLNVDPLDERGKKDLFGSDSAGFVRTREFTSGEQSGETSLEMTTMERRILLQKVFVQVLVRLCSHPGPGEELARKDDLSLLFSASTSWCPAHNVCWRRSAAEVLMTLSRHALSQPVVAYIHSKGCVALCVENMERTQDLSPLEIVEMLVAIFCFLKDSADFSQTLFDDFKAAQGYAFLVDFILRLEQESISSNSGIASPVEGLASSSSNSSNVSSSNSSPSTTNEAHEALRNLVLLVASLTYCGHSQPRPTLHPSTALYTLSGFTLPMPSTRGGSVRNVPAFSVLQLVFLRATSATLCNVVLDAISSVYHSDAANYFILEPQATLSTFAEKIHVRTPQVQGKYFELIELVVFELNHVPCKELISLSLMLKAHHTTHPDCITRCLTTLTAILRHHLLFKDVYREVGLLEVLVTCVGRYPSLLAHMTPQQLSDTVLSSTTTTGSGSPWSASETICVQGLEALTLLLTASAGNAGVFREAGGARLLLALVPYTRCRQMVLGLMHQVIVVGGNDEDMTALLDVLNCPPLLPRPSSASASSTTPPTAAPPYPQAAESTYTGPTAVTSAPGAGDGSEAAPHSDVAQGGLPPDVGAGEQKPSIYHDTIQVDMAEVEHRLNLRIDILKALVTCLKESHRSRAVFRKVGGFVRVLSVVVGMRDAFSDAPGLQAAHPQPLLLSLLSGVFAVLTTAMRYEPANAKFFHSEICNGSLCETLRQLGCFNTACTQIQPSTAPHWVALLTPPSLLPTTPKRAASKSRSNSPHRPSPQAKSPSHTSPLHHPPLSHSQSLFTAFTSACSPRGGGPSSIACHSPLTSTQSAGLVAPKGGVPLQSGGGSPRHEAPGSGGGGGSNGAGGGLGGVDDHIVVNAFHSAFTTPLLVYSAPAWLPLSMARSLQVIQLLYHMALDSFDKPTAPPAFAPPSTLPTAPTTTTTTSTAPAGTAAATDKLDPGSGVQKRPGVGVLNLSQCGGMGAGPVSISSEVLIVHSGVVVTLLQLLPALLHPRHPRLSALLQLYTAHLLKSLVRSERNQQVMCQGGLCRVLGDCGGAALLEEQHPLHPLLHYIYERLAAHAISPTELRSFLRLGDPLNCRSVESFNCNDEATHRGPVPLARTKTLVAMTTPRHASRGTGASAAVQAAPFVEFDMSAEGFGCLFLPSLAPHAPMGGPGGLGATGTAASVVGGALGSGQQGEHAVIGGIGTGDRVFPPQSGLSYSTWFSVERFSDPRSDPHSVRLLTVVRSAPNRTAHLVCLVVCLSARDKALIVSTQEVALPHQGQVIQEMEPPLSGDCGCRVWCPDLLTEGQWHHLVVTLNRAVLKNSALSIYVDGKLVQTQRLHYISLSPGGGVANLSVPSSVYGYIGSAPTYRKLSRLVWRQGVCHLLEDVLSPTSVTLLHQLGPNYTGSLQAPQLPGCDASPAIVLEEKVMLGLNAAALSHFTLSKIRKFYSKVDSKAIAKQLGMSSHENATPIRVVHNSAGHLNGPARSMGGVVIGYLGVRVFCPRPVAAVLQTLGGTAVLLGLVAMSTDVETLYASVKALSCVVKASKTAQVSMARSSGYQTLGQLLRRKLLLLTSPILHLCLGLVLAGDHTSPANGKLCSNASSPAIPNLHAFTDLVLDLELWCSAPGELWKPLLEYLLELAKESPDGHNNLKIMRSLGLVPRFLHLLYDYLTCRESPLPCSSSSHNTALLPLPQNQSSPALSSPSSSHPHSSPGLSSPSSSHSHYSHAPATSPLLYSLMTVLLAVNPRQEDLLSYGQFIFATLPHPSGNEKDIDLESASNNADSRLGTEHHSKDKPTAGSTTGDMRSSIGPESSMITSSASDAPSNMTASYGSSATNNNGCASPGNGTGVSPRTIVLRNKCLEIVHTLLYNSNKNTIHLGFCEEVVRVLGLDWVVVLTGPHLHSSTVLVALRMLVALLSNSSILHKFREASSNGGWLTNLQQVTSDRHGLVLGYAVGGRGLGAVGEVREEVCSVPGFQVLTSNMTAHVRVPQSYLLMLALMLGQPVKTVPAATKFEVSSIWTFLFGCPATAVSGNIAGRASLCPEAVITTLVMIRAVIKPGSSLPAWLQAYPQTLLQFLMFLHRHNDDFLPVLLTCEVVTALALTVFPVGGEVVGTPHADKRGLSTDMEVVTVLDSSGNSSHKGGLSEHPARADVVSLLEQLVLDSLLMPPPNKPPHTLDYVLDAPPEQSSGPLVSQFYTLVLGALMARVKESVAAGAGVLEGTWIRPGGYLPAGGSSQHVPPNLFYLIARMVDKLWAGQFHQDPHPLLDLVVSLIACAKQQRGGGTAVQCTDLIYSCLNRTVLYLLSRPCDTTTVQRAVLEGLHKLTTHRVIVFGAGNHDLEFVACLTHCLLQLTAQIQISTDSTVRTVWHVNSIGPNSAENSCSLTNSSSISDIKNVSSSSCGGGPSPAVIAEEARQNIRQRDEAMARATQSHHLMITAATRVWEELYITKKPAIEEVFKVSLPVTNSSSCRAPALETVRIQVTESAHRFWLAFLDAEKKQTYATRMMPWEMPTHFQTVTNVSKKLQKVTGGLTRLASRTKNRREDSLVTRKSTVSMAPADVARLSAVHVALVRELVAVQHSRHLQKHEDLFRYCWSVWEREERELTRERGLWGPTAPCHLDKWILDATEGPCRMRKKMVANSLFYLHYPPHKPLSELEQGRQSKYKMAYSFHSEEHYRKSRPLGLANREQQHAHFREPASAAPDVGDGAAVSFVGKDVTDMDVSSLKGTLKAHANTTELGDGLLMSVGEEDGDPSELLDSGIGGSEQFPLPAEDVHSPDNQTLLRLLEQDEKVSHMFRCARIQGLDTTEALLLFGREHFYIVDGFTLLKTREIRDIESLPPGSHDPVIPSATTGGTSGSSGGGGPPLAGLADPHACSKLHYDEIREALQRRYLLQPIGIEIFSSDGRNYLLAFPKAKERNKVYQRMLVVCTGLADSAHQSVEGQRRSASVEQTGGLFSSLIGETSVTHRWVRGEISNFQYLMHLNTLAGRSYNDLMQYPIFPWVLADYESHSLDFNSTSTFRDLSKPMGAQTPDRLEQFRKRYREWDDPSGETPPYHYGTHYSSAMIVSSYLVRMEPFTQHFLRLQGGHFDLADRMFHSLKEAWMSASRNNMADIKELIPEFFYLSEFLENSNRFDLGIKQSGVQLDDVILPPWAKGDPREFIRLHRAALECDFVSANLHHWIDLIFGCKQQGQPAVDAVNVFHHLFYEGNVDIYSIDDPLKQKATIGFINNFGQIPKQLFRRAHPCKKLSGQRTSIMEASPLAQAPAVTPREKVFYKQLEQLRPALQPLKEVKGVVGQIISLDKGVLAVEQNKVLIPSSYQRYLACGFADHSLRIGPYESDKALLVYEGECEQTGEVLAAVCPNARTVVTASTDTVVRVYEIYRRQLQPKTCLYGHSDAVTCLAASSAYGILVSGSRDKTAIIWDLARLTFVRQLTGHHAPLAACAINDSTGDIGTCGGPWLHLWSINGSPIASVNTALGARSALQQVLCLAFTTAYEWDHDNLIITGSSDGVIRMWGMEYVQAPVDEDSENSSSNNSRSSTSHGARASLGANPIAGGKSADNTGNNSDEEGVSVRSQRVERKRRRSRQAEEEAPFTGSYLRKTVSESSLSEDNEEEESAADDLSDTEGGGGDSVKPTGSREKPLADPDVICDAAGKEKSNPNTLAEILSDCEQKDGAVFTEVGTTKADDVKENSVVTANIDDLIKSEVSPVGSKELSLFESKSASISTDVSNKSPDGSKSPSGGDGQLAHGVLRLHRQEALASTGSHTSLETSGSLDTAASTSPRTLHPTGVVRTVSAADRTDSTTSFQSRGGPVTATTNKRLQSSKSETCLADTATAVGVSSDVAADAFEVITEAEVREAQDQDPVTSPQVKNEVLLPGMRWACQLVFRSKLTAHTAYDRADNIEPASVTAITVAKDHRGLLVGDARGRVFSWTIVDVARGGANGGRHAASVGRGRGLGGSSSNLSSGGSSSGGPADHWMQQI